MPTHVKDATPMSSRRAAIMLGERHAYEGRRMEALRCFYRAGDYERMLSLELSGLCMERAGEVTYEQVALSIARDCPEDTGRAHPVSLLRVAYALYGYGRAGEYAALMERVKGYIAPDDDELMGEWLMIDALRHFPDVKGMRDAYARASELLRGPARCVAPEEPYMFGCPSMWFLFHVKAGGADERTAELADMIKLYSRLTGGHGAGADVLYAGEVACMRGNLIRARLLAGKAAAMAARAGQTGVRIGAELLAGRAAVSSADMAALRQALYNIEQLGKSGALHKSAAAVANGMLMGMVEQTERTEQWLREGNLRENVMAPTLPMAGYVHIMDMLSRKEYARALGLMEAMRAQGGMSVACGHYVDIGMSLCYMALGDKDSAAQSLARALDISLPDGILTTFVRFRAYLTPLYFHPQLKSHENALARIDNMDVTFEKSGVLSMDFDTPPHNLTRREYDVALLAARGLRNREIAQALSIGESTVKQYMYVVFQKLRTDRRSDLARLLSPRGK